MSSLLEMAWDIVANNEATSRMTKEQVLGEIRQVYVALTSIEKGEAPETQGEGQSAPVISVRKAFGKSKVTCMICGKEMKTLARHLKTAHDLKPGPYKKQFGIPSKTPLAAKDYSASRKQMALDRGLGANLAKARAAKKANVEAVKPKAGKGKVATPAAAKPAVKKPSAKKEAKPKAKPAAE